MKEIWMRAGITISMTDEEADAILEGDYETRMNALRTILAEGRFSWNGETYIPAECIQMFNSQYGMQYEDEEYEFQL